MFNKPVRSTQTIGAFGIGAMIDFPGESLMVAGLDAWPEIGALLTDKRLARRLGVQYFVTPPPPPEQGIKGGFLPVVRFPLWHQCIRCGAISPTQWNAPGAPRCSCEKTTKKQQNQPCSSYPEKRRSRMVPLRFVVACEKGHIDDFPWELWVHRKKGQKLSEVTLCSKPILELYTTGRAGLEGLVVHCLSCGEKHSMVQATQEGLIGYKCTGRRPWLGYLSDSTESGCPAVPRMVQRASSNIYFSKVASSILIPPYSDPTRKLVDDPFIWSFLESAVVDGQTDPLRVKQAVDYLKQKGKTVDANALVKAVKLKKAGDAGDTAAMEQNETEYRRAEYMALLGPSTPAESEFVIRPQAISEYDEWTRRYIDRIILVEKLAETRVLTGFSRLRPPETKLDADVALLSLTRKPWLPGVRIYGEGIFFTVRDDQINMWSTRPDVQGRLKVLAQREVKVAIERARPPRDLQPKFFLLHSFAHVLLRRLSFECGYGTSAVRERIYCEQNGTVPMSGILIYTAAGDSEGTLGGLVRQGKPGRFDDLLRSAIADAIWCSSDPICIESPGQGSDSLNLAACHACTLLPETSCEEGNRLLDRATLIGLRDKPEVGMFGELAEELLK